MAYTDKYTTFAEMSTRVCQEMHLLPASGGGVYYNAPCVMYTKTKQAA